ncbi:hypothetical protein DL768_008365 [Monosporascus sp. mg162]|nr:hypothetical protein DL768_008365 [Monosporascus sp. mg162]
MPSASTVEWVYRNWRPAPPPIPPGPPAFGYQPVRWRDVPEPAVLEAQRDPSRVRTYRTPIIFKTTWYIHPAGPNYYICSSCYGEKARSCDLAVPYIRREYSVRTAEDDWGSFVREVSARISLPARFKEKPVYPDGRTPFTPINGLQGFLACAAFFCDYVTHTGQASKWRGAGGSLARVFGLSVQ